MGENEYMAIMLDHRPTATSKTKTGGMAVGIVQLIKNLLFYVFSFTN